MPTMLRRGHYLNHWCPATPVRVEGGGWIAYLTLDAAVLRMTEGRREDFNLARAQITAGLKVERRSGTTYELVSGPDAAR